MSLTSYPGMALPQTLVLARITPRQFKQLSSPYKALPTVDPDPLCSNVYSLGERILLLWLNHNYEQQRSVIWSTCTKGEQLTTIVSHSFLPLLSCTIFMNVIVLCLVQSILVLWKCCL